MNSIDPTARISEGAVIADGGYSAVGSTGERDEREEGQTHDAGTQRELDRCARLTVAERRPHRGEDAREDDDEDRVDRVHNARRQIHAEDVTVESLVGVDRHDGELLLEQ